MNNEIIVRGARQHNLKNINLSIPKNKLIVFTGVSGSGKSSLAFDTIYAEGQRRYVESLSSYARQFLGIMDKPDVDAIIGLSPAISIDQKTASHNPRSTVGTVTEIYDYLRLLFARIGHPHCPNCGREVMRQTPDQIVQAILSEVKSKRSHGGKKPVRCMILSPVVRDRKGEFTGLFSNLRSKGYRQVRVDSHVYEIDDDITLIKTNKHSIDVVIDRFTLDKNTVTSKEYGIKLREAVEQSLVLSSGLVIASWVSDPEFQFPKNPKQMDDQIFSERFSCPVCNISLPEIEPRMFSFNSPHGACPACSGIGKILTVDPSLIIAPELSLSEGGIIPFAKMFYHDTWYSRLVMTVADQYKIDLKIPLKHVTEEQLNVLLHGTGETTYTVSGTNRFGEATVIHEQYPGVLAELKKRYSQTESEWMRSEIEKYMREELCSLCGGKRLKNESLSVTIHSQSIAQVTSFHIDDAAGWVRTLASDTEYQRNNQEKIISTPILKEIESRLTFLSDVGLEYLTLDRAAMTLSGGESQRIRLASQIGSGLSGVLYVLDEPSIGLHPRDNHRLIDTLYHLRDLGNTAIVVEHDREMMEAADFLVDFGPGAGAYGGEVIASGVTTEVKQNAKSVTAAYLNGSKQIKRTKSRKTPENGYITLYGAKENNLKTITAKFPIGLFTCVTGVSGSGKSTLVVETLYPALNTQLSPVFRQKPGAYDRLDGAEKLDKVILIDQSPIGRTPRSNPSTYTGIFTYIRELFASLPTSRMRGFTPGRFSFNMKGGRCEACEGEGVKRIEMQFLSDVYVTCEVCGGSRYSMETLDILYNGKNIAEILAFSIDEAVQFFRHHPGISDKLQTLTDIGLGYMKMGQPATTLSGGEAQRVKLASELMRRSTGKTVYILDEPTTGLHFKDLEKLLHIIYRLTDTGNTVIVIEHNLDVIKNADWIIDMGPEGGDKGGYILTSGDPHQVAGNTTSYTGKFLSTYGTI